MSGKESIGGVAYRLQRFLARAGALSLAVLLPVGILHATPITSYEVWRSQNSKPLASYGSVSAEKKAPSDLMVVNPAREPQLETATALQPANSGCTFAGDCSDPVKVPEPQSLVMVGTGLLTMAGLIRRRLLR